MQGQLVEGGALNYILITPDGYNPEASYPLIVLLHGFGASMYDLAGLAPAINAGGYIYAFPNAPYEVDLGGGVGYSWSLGRPGMPDLANIEGPTPEQRLMGFMGEVTAAARTEPGKVVLGGFSQGGGLTLRFGLANTQHLAGLVVLSGAFREPEGIRDQLPPDRDTPIFVAHGLFDPMVPVERGQATRAFLEESGYMPEYHEYEMAHEITEELLADLKPWIERVLPPR